MSERGEGMARLTCPPVPFVLHSLAVLYLLSNFLLASRDMQGSLKRSTARVFVVPTFKVLSRRNMTGDNDVLF